ncbi:MAG: sulfite exporter TauE/SafE family protein [Bermanella sp.]
MLDLSSPDLLLLALATIITSGFAAVLGQGGGLMLFALLSVYIDLPLLIAIHAVIQMSSNSSRAVFALPHIRWKLISPILIGTIIGAILITPALEHTNWQWMQPIMGAYILYLTWKSSLPLSMTFTVPGALFSSGLLQGSLGMLLGATGPLSNALLVAKGLTKDTIVASNAVIMSTSHLIKIILFSLLGISLWADIELLILLSSAAILGSFIGNKLRSGLPEYKFNILFKALLTLLALRMMLLNIPFL